MHADEIVDQFYMLCEIESLFGLSTLCNIPAMVYIETFPWS